MVRRPEEYRWSSYGVNAWGDTSWLQPHDEYLSLGHTEIDRYHAYRALFVQPFSEGDLLLIRKAAHYCQPIGDDRFRQYIKKKYGFKSGQMMRGRPRKKTDELVKL